MKILIVSPISEHAVEALRLNHEVVRAFNAPQQEIMDAIVDCDCLIFRSGPDINADVMRRAPNLRLLVRAGSGLDNLDLDYVRRHGIELHRIERPGARAVAELAFCLMLALARQIRHADASLRAGKWEKHNLTGYLLANKTLGIYGAGNIGSVTGQMGKAWGMNVIGCVENPTGAVAEQLARDGIKLASPSDVLSQSDFMSIHVPLQDSTRNLIDEAALAQMKPSAFLVNLARGGVVDERALLDALVNGRLAGAGLDVHEKEGDGLVSPLADLPNVLLTPHVGAGTVDTKYAIGEEVLDIVAQFSATDGEAQLLAASSV